MTKQAEIECLEEFRGTDVNCLLAVHDALVFEVPGKATINWEKSVQKKGIWTDLKFNITPEATEVAQKIVEIMVRVETAMFQDLNSPIQGMAEYGLGMYWSH